MEFGARSLGNRAILCNANDINLVKEKSILIGQFDPFLQKEIMSKEFDDDHIVLTNLWLIYSEIICSFFIFLWILITVKKLWYNCMNSEGVILHNTILR